MTKTPEQEILKKDLTRETETELNELIETLLSKHKEHPTQLSDLSRGTVVMNLALLLTYSHPDNKQFAKDKIRLGIVDTISSSPEVLVNVKFQLDSKRQVFYQSRSQFQQITDLVVLTDDQISTLTILGFQIPELGD